ncbi:GGDEF domain-containing response regulator [Neobacillus cucumis]|uniref:Diguanylate cyclase response regulator n=1 Tax=Neobacillus cucumis TaxID=1740721 RepID=A0A2N5HVI2_9BACI|nr:diguanylate cyclase [Neobacillus cucumis]PLS09516.1 diguanylate cyclase response regulator [Neobacillus cucumis]
MARSVLQYLKYQYPDIRVLYVEDEKFSREKLLRVLNRRFAHIHVAIDGVEGLQLYQKYKPDLIIADIKMNQMSGLEMIKKIRTQNEKVQVIVTTAHEDNDFFVQSIENNVNHFILKPIDLDLLLQAIQKSVYQIQLEKELEKQKILTRSILDFQDNLIFVIENGEIVEWNQAFTNITGIGIPKNNQTSFQSQFLSSFFVEDPHYFYPKDKGRWMEEFFANERKVAKVRWKGPLGNDYNYVMKAGQIPGTKQTLFVLTDITDLEKESREREHLAMLDPLTSSYTRQKFKEILASEMRRAERFDRAFSLILMDIDNFHTLNDQFGQTAGDKVLITVSTIVQQRIRECDMFARWGGEEFILLIPETDGKNAMLLANSIRSIIEKYEFLHIGNVTASFGVTEFAPGKTKNELISEAEQALADSKNNGRNRVTLYTKER